MSNKPDIVEDDEAEGPDPRFVDSYPDSPDGAGARPVGCGVQLLRFAL